MDFLKLRTKDLIDFLSLYQRYNPKNEWDDMLSEINHDQIHADLARDATILYNELVASNNPNVQITNGVYDLIKATSLLGSDRKYNEESIDKISQQDLQLLSNAVGINADKNRLKDLLLMAGLIIPHTVRVLGREPDPVRIEYPLTRYGEIYLESLFTVQQIMSARMYLNGEKIMNIIYNRSITENDYMIFQTNIQGGELSDPENIRLFNSLIEHHMGPLISYVNPSTRQVVTRKEFMGDMIYEGMEWDIDRYILQLGS